jgi:hypothetical protein
VREFARADREATESRYSQADVKVILAKLAATPQGIRQRALLDFFEPDDLETGAASGKSIENADEACPPRRGDTTRSQVTSRRPSSYRRSYQGAGIR